MLSSEMQAVRDEMLYRNATAAASWEAPTVRICGVKGQLITGPFNAAACVTAPFDYGGSDVAEGAIIDPLREIIPLTWSGNALDGSLLLLIHVNDSGFATSTGLTRGVRSETYGSLQQTPMGRVIHTGVVEVLADDNFNRIYTVDAGPMQMGITLRAHAAIPISPTVTTPAGSVLLAWDTMPAGLPAWANVPTDYPLPADRPPRYFLRWAAENMEGMDLTRIPVSEWDANWGMYRLHYGKIRYFQRTTAIHQYVLSTTPDVPVLRVTAGTLLIPLVVDASCSTTITYTTVEN